MSNTYILDLKKKYDEPELNELVDRLKSRFSYPIHIERTKHQDWLPALVGMWATIISVGISSAITAALVPVLAGPMGALSFIALALGLVFLICHLSAAMTVLIEPARMNNLRADSEKIQIDISPGSGWTHISKLHEIPDGFERAIHLLSEEKFYRNAKRSKTLKALGVQPKMMLLTDKKASEGSVSLARKQVSGGELSLAKQSKSEVHI